MSPIDTEFLFVVLYQEIILLYTNRQSSPFHVFY